MYQYSKYVGLDVHKEKIMVAVAQANRRAPVYYGEIANTSEAIAKVVRKIAGQEDTGFCYEAGPCGYGLYRQVTAMGYRCDVVAPSLIPKKSGTRVKTDRRDALALAGLYRAGELTPVWVPDKEQEARGELARAGEGMKMMGGHKRQRLGGFFLRTGKVFSGGGKGKRG